MTFQARQSHRAISCGGALVAGELTGIVLGAHGRVLVLHLLLRLWAC